ncbi:class I SAM-dependent methyltransferase [Variovorax sp. J31P179]|uniref:class I SAM-dependent methyltransferase n=1 Tax=Variovorax sp. J31P179 TaxID=3053508 RepID=UPI002574B50F|nr:class I SAM-dependent methyltransferase [Variovorax sp. J31P179]MDM0081964.1 class I SAM-dependent methyltransferase [Variovorax sp. J31P179]
MHRYAAPDLKPMAGHLTNFLGVRINPEFFPGLLNGRAGEVEGAPLPANWHADIAEWGAAFRAVDLSRETFTMIELGCGWGCWMNNTGVAARRVSRKVHLIGVEGDEGHIEFAKESLATNGFGPDEFDLHHGIAAANAGIALFPKQEQAGMKWGLEPVFGATEEQQRQQREAVKAGSHDALPMVPMSQLVADHARVDLLHIDIQGGEADLVEGCLPLLNEKIAYMLIGTHSKQIEGRLYDRLLGVGWRLELERAAHTGTH